MTDAERRRRVEHVCDAALDRDPRDRAAFVVAACGGDDALRREAEALLAHAQAAEGFLAAPIGAVAAHVLGEEPWRRSWGGTSARTRSCRIWGRAVWARSIARATRHSIATSR